MLVCVRWIYTDRSVETESIHIAETVTVKVRDEVNMLVISIIIIM